MFKTEMQQTIHIIKGNLKGYSIGMPIGLAVAAVLYQISVVLTNVIVLM